MLGTLLILVWALIMSQRANRRLSAIVSADVAGYSRLMGADEAGTHAALKGHLSAITPIFQRHGGRLVKTTGDGLLLEFSSVVGAVEAAIESQALMAERTGDASEGRRIRFRIGIHLGDVILDLDDNDIYGDGVNIAARLQEVAEPGGVALSRIVAESVRGKITAAVVDAGVQTFKNIAEPMQVFRVNPRSRLFAGSTGEVPLALPDKPSIAVMPFRNLSGDRDQEYFADGITEEIITELSRFRSLFVIARSSSFAYKDKPADVRQVGRDLGIRYVLDGSIRRGGDRVRVSAQLVEADTGRQIWAERYDRNLEDIFDLQEEITRTIVASIDNSIFAVEVKRIERKRPESLAEWELLTRARALMFDVYSPELRGQAHDLADQILERNPSCGEAYGMKAMVDVISAYAGHAAELEKMQAQAREWALRARKFDAWDQWAVSALAYLETMRRRPEAAVRLCADLVEVYPNSSWALTALALARSHALDHEGALQATDMALRLNPKDPVKDMLLNNKGHILSRADRFAEAESAFKHALELRPTFPQALRGLVLCYVKLGRLDEAKFTAGEFLKAAPSATIRSLLAIGARPETLEAFRIAGVPE